MPGSALEEYSRNYGARLRSMLDGGSGLVEDPNAPRGSPNGRPDLGDMNAMDSPQMRSRLEGPQSGEGAYIEPPVIPMEAGGTADPSGGQDMGGPMAQPQLASELGGDPEAPGSALEGQTPAGGEGAYTFRQMWKDAPEAAREKEMTKLEEALKRGNQTIDQAYDDLEKQLGTKPDKRRKLTRQEKGMLLMEWGLNVLANNKKGFGALGEAGVKTMQSYDQIAGEDYRKYEKRKDAIDNSRAGAKVGLAQASALEGLKDPANRALRLPGKFTGEDGTVYFYDEDGQVKQATGPDGKPIKGELKGDGAGGRGFESDAKYNRYMEIYGIDEATGKPLTGLALQKVKQDALDFANDRGNSIDDLDLDILAEKSADTEMNADAYRDLTPEQREARRSEIAAARRKRLTRPDRRRSGSALEPPPGPKKRFASEADARAAFKRGEIRKGDMIIVNGVEGAVE